MAPVALFSSNHTFSSSSMHTDQSTLPLLHSIHTSRPIPHLIHEQFLTVLISAPTTTYTSYIELDNASEVTSLPGSLPLSSSNSQVTYTVDPKTPPNDDTARVVGIVVGCIVGILLLAVVGYLCLCRRRRGKRSRRRRRRVETSRRKRRRKRRVRKQMDIIVVEKEVNGDTTAPAEEGGT